MSEKLPVISGKDFIKVLEKAGFAVIRINGSHHRLKHPDGRITTIPIHKNDPLPKRLLRKIFKRRFGNFSGGFTFFGQKLILNTNDFNHQKLFFSPIKKGIQNENWINKKTAGRSGKY